MNDAETTKILNEQQLISEIIGHSGWRYIRAKFDEKIAILKDAFEVDASTPEAMFNDMNARRAAVILIQELLRDIEGSVEVMKSNPVNTKSLVVKLD